MADMRALADELRAAIPDKTRWFGMSQPTFVAAGRVDGKATVQCIASTDFVLGSGGWRVVRHVDGAPVVELFLSAAEAVAAAVAIPAEVSVPAL